MGKFFEILQDQDATMGFVIIDAFQVSAVQHDYFGMPILSRCLNETTLLVILATVGSFLFI
jgi:hypothetical protein